VAAVHLLSLVPQSLSRTVLCATLPTLLFLFAEFDCGAFWFPRLTLWAVFLYSNDTASRRMRSCCERAWLCASDASLSFSRVKRSRIHRLILTSTHKTVHHRAQDRHMVITFFKHLGLNSEMFSGIVFCVCVCVCLGGYTIHQSSL